MGRIGLLSAFFHKPFIDKPAAFKGGSPLPVAVIKYFAGIRGYQDEILKFKGIPHCDGKYHQSGQTDKKDRLPDARSH